MVLFAGSDLGGQCSFVRMDGSLEAVDACSSLRRGPRYLNNPALLPMRC